jgi:hypothetical protein
MTEDTKKRCKTCGGWKLRAEFSPHAETNDRLRPECKPCRAEGTRAWYAANRARAATASAAYQAAHRKEKSAYDADRYAANREGVMTRAALYYATNREKALAANRKRRIAGLEYVNSLKVGGCVDCGAKPPPDQLHWHHLDPRTKTDKVSMLVACSRETIDTEIGLCVLVCPPCHIERHRQMRQAA